MQHRYNIAKETKTHLFKPDALPIDRLEGDKRLALKHAEIGSIMMPFKSKLQAMQAIKIVWETELKTNPPAQIAAIKPKCWLTRPLTLKPGIAKLLA